MNASLDILSADMITKHSYQVVCRYRMHQWYAGREVSHPEQASVRLYHDHQNGVQLLADIKYIQIDEITCNIQYMLALIMSKSILMGFFKC